MVSWMHQIKLVMDDDPEKLLHSSEHPGAGKQVTCAGPAETLHPKPGTPVAQVEFWHAKAVSLNNINEQLESPKVKQIVAVLKAAKSSYAPAFGKLCEEVEASRAEANSNDEALSVLDKLFSQMDPGSSPDYRGIAVLFRPIIRPEAYLDELKHFNSTTPGGTLPDDWKRPHQERDGAAEGEKIFEMEPEAIEKIKTTIEVCVQLSALTSASRKLCLSAKKTLEGAVNGPRGRVDSFVERCTDVQDVVETVHQFQRLEKIEIGGTKGRTLTTSVIQVYKDFLDALSVFLQIEYVVFDLEEKQFEIDYSHFRMKIKELERRLSSVVAQALEDCSSVDAFKLLATLKPAGARRDPEQPREVLHWPTDRLPC